MYRKSLGHTYKTYGAGSVVEHFPTMHEALGSSPKTTKQKQNPCNFLMIQIKLDTCSRKKNTGFSN